MISIIVVTKDRSNLLKDCLKSIKQSTFKDIEIIVVDNNSSDNTLKFLKSLRNLKIISNKINEGLAGGKNRGVVKAKGEYVLFIDDDNVIDKNMIKNLYQAFRKDPEIIASSPLTFYFMDKKRIWFAGAKFNLFTSKPKFLHQIPKDGEIIESDILHNVLMIKRSVGDVVGWYDKELVMNTDFDFFVRLKRSFKGKKVLVVRNAISYHNIPLPQNDKDPLRNFGFSNELRVYYFARNRGLLMKRFAPRLNLLIFIFLFYPFFTLYYAFQVIRFKRFDFLIAHLRGTIDGYKYIFFNSLNNSYFKK